MVDPDPAGGHTGGGRLPHRGAPGPCRCAAGTAYPERPAKGEHAKEH